MSEIIEKDGRFAVCSRIFNSRAEAEYWLSLHDRITELRGLDDAEARIGDPDWDDFVKASIKFMWGVNAAELKQSAARLHALGPLPLAHFLAELTEGRDLHETLSRYLALDPVLVRAVGADKLDATATAAIAALTYVPPKGCA